MSGNFNNGRNNIRINEPSQERELGVPTSDGDNNEAFALDDELLQAKPTVVRKRVTVRAQDIVDKYVDSHVMTNLDLSNSNSYLASNSRWLMEDSTETHN